MALLKILFYKIKQPFHFLVNHKFLRYFGEKTTNFAFRTDYLIFTSLAAGRSAYTDYRLFRLRIADLFLESRSQRKMKFRTKNQKKKRNRSCPLNLRKRSMNPVERSALHCLLVVQLRRHTRDSKSCKK